MSILAIDIETYSSVDLTKAGVYAYTEREDFEILLLAYAFEDEPVEIIDFKLGDRVPKQFLEALTNPNILKTAFNANFERVCISKFFNLSMEENQWSCTAVDAMRLGLPASLEGVSTVLRLEEGKLKEGKDLIKLFTLPRKGDSSAEVYERNLPEDNIKQWLRFREYCKRDVEVERSIRKILERYPMTSEEKRLWNLDQRINDRGIRVHEELLHKALKCARSYEDELLRQASILTGLKNPKSCLQMKTWLFQKEEIKVQSLSKAQVEELLETVDNPEVKKALELKKKLSKTSIKKYEAMERCKSQDGRIRGLLKFYGASRTGRWSGRMVQVQNLPQNKLHDSDLARNLLLQEDYTSLETIYGSVTEVLSQLIRTAFIPSKDCRFIISDFSAIEARVIAWLAGERWRQEVFSSHGKIYEASASQMFNVPLESIQKDSPLRQKGKIAELALGYQGSTGALKAMGAEKMGVKETELKDLVSNWRRTNPAIVKLWYDIERAALTSIRDKTTVAFHHGIEFYYRGAMFFVRLPSGRALAYARPRIEIDTVFNKQIINYEGTNQVTKQWGRLKTYGGKLTENIVQAIARDCLGQAMLELEEKGYATSIHVHDEVVLDVPYGFGSVKEVEKIMTKEIHWAPGLKLAVEAFEGSYYCK